MIPKHTAASVAQKLQAGLSDGSITLNESAIAQREHKPSEFARTDGVSATSLGVLVGRALGFLLIRVLLPVTAELLFAWLAWLALR
jgi:hypothetical protein